MLLRTSREATGGATSASRLFSSAATACVLLLSGSAPARLLAVLRLLLVLGLAPSLHSSSLSLSEALSSGYAGSTPGPQGRCSAAARQVGSPQVGGWVAAEREQYEGSADSFREQSSQYTPALPRRVRIWPLPMRSPEGFTAPCSRRMWVSSSLECRRDSSAASSSAVRSSLRRGRRQPME